MVELALVEAWRQGAECLPDKRIPPPLVMLLCEALGDKVART